MKTNFLILLILLCIGAKNYAQNVNIPDANFKAALVGNTAINTNGDSEIQVSEASAYADTIDVSFKNISDLTGIGAFTQITKLYCNNNLLTSLFLSNNIALTYLDCNFNQLSTLSISNNNLLTYLNCGYNQLSSLSIFNNNLLTYLDCAANQLSTLSTFNNNLLTYLNCASNLLTSLDVSNNTALELLDCPGNPLTSLDVSNNNLLTFLNCASIPLTSLDVSNNTALELLDCSLNQLTSLDVSNNIALTYLDCSYTQLSTLSVFNNNLLTFLNCAGNQLGYLSVSNNNLLTHLNCGANQLSSLSISNNTNLQAFTCASNPNLFCIEVYNINYANTNWTAANGNIDSTMYFSLDCGYTSTAENLSSSLSILPNPASDYLYISYEGEKKLSFTISDIWGKTLAAWGAHSAGAFYQKQVPIADFPVGIYFLSVQAGDKKVVKKFIKE